LLCGRGRNERQQNEECYRWFSHMKKESPSAVVYDLDLRPICVARTGIKRLKPCGPKNQSFSDTDLACIKSCR
jgi:hypothetical protein